MISIKNKHSARKILANNIVYYRLKKGLSQEELAELLETTPVYLSSLENAKRNIKELFTEREIIEKKKRPKKKKIK